MAEPIFIYTDGSALGNPGPGGFSAVIKNGSKKEIVKGGVPFTTNNRMEMEAIRSALNWLKKNKKTSAIIFSDSNLIVSTINHNWKKKANLDLWTLIYKELAGLKVEFRWVKAHVGHPGNEEANRLALMEAKKQKTQKLLGKTWANPETKPESDLTLF